MISGQYLPKKGSFTYRKQYFFSVKQTKIQMQTPIKITWVWFVLFLFLVLKCVPLVCVCACFVLFIQSNNIFSIKILSILFCSNSVRLKSKWNACTNFLSEHLSFQADFIYLLFFLKQFYEQFLDFIIIIMYHMMIIRSHISLTKKKTKTFFFAKPHH